MADATPLMVLWSGPGLKVVRARWTAAGTLAPDLPSLAPAPSAADWDGGGPARPVEPSVLAFLLAPETAAGLSGERFASELQPLKAPPSPRLLTLAGTGRHGDEEFAAFLIDPGPNLAAGLSEWRFLGWEEACKVLMALAEALAAAHAGGLTAGVVEAHHVQMGPESTTRLALPGPELALRARRLAIAKAGAPDTLPLAPEVRAGGEPAPAGDMYSVGALGFQLVCGKAPADEDFQGARDGAALAALAFRLAQREFDVPRGLFDIVAALTHPDPAQRPTAAALSPQLDAVLHGQLAQAVKLVHGEKGADAVDPLTGIPRALNEPVKSAGGSFAAMGRLMSLAEGPQPPPIPTALPGVPSRVPLPPPPPAPEQPPVAPQAPAPLDEEKIDPSDPRAVLLGLVPPPDLKPLPPRPAGFPVAKFVAMFVILVIFAYTLSKMRIPLDKY